MTRVPALSPGKKTTPAPAGPGTLVPVKTRKKIDPELIRQLSVQPEEQKLIVVHCTVFVEGIRRVRIWPSTFLFGEDCNARSTMIQSTGITTYPEWMLVGEAEPAKFTLFFEPLPADCKLFSLVEEIPESGGFYYGNIARNNEDVYRIEL